jgi:threonylcarbamoyladenosine tRNA methylthiotransferase MtaB
VREIGFGHVHIFAYSPRQGTRAAMLPNRVAADTVRARSRVLHEVAAELRTAHALTFLGEPRSVLWESRAAKASLGETRWLGYTDNYLRVVSVPLERSNLQNRITPARLDRETSGPTALLEATPLLD